MYLKIFWKMEHLLNFPYFQKLKYFDQNTCISGIIFFHFYHEKFISKNCKYIFSTRNLYIWVIILIYIYCSLLR